jgi:hypothetical protein
LESQAVVVDQVVMVMGMPAGEWVRGRRRTRDHEEKQIMKPNVQEDKQILETK